MKHRVEHGLALDDDFFKVYRLLEARACILAYKRQREVKVMVANALVKLYRSETAPQD